MHNKRSKITDILIIILILVIAILVFVSGYFNFNVKKRIYEDSYFINQLGLIRGNIQRYTKFKIANQNNEDIINEIEITLSNIKLILHKEKSISNKFYYTFNVKLDNIIQNIHKLELLSNKKQLLNLSEKLWDECNDLIQTALNHHKYKFVKTINMFNYIIDMTVIFLIFLSLFLFKKVKKGLEVENITDKLTGLYNRLYFNEIYDYFIRRYNRNKQSFSMLIIDIDNFKHINDTYGHTTGDEVLKQIGSIIKETIRKTDFAFRYGGEEFVIIYPDTSIEEAFKVSQRLLETIPQKILINLNPVTISGGIGEYKGEDSKEFFEKIDEALYLAKATGKNKIIKL